MMMAGVWKSRASRLLFPVVLVVAGWPSDARASLGATIQQTAPETAQQMSEPVSEAITLRPSVSASTNDPRLARIIETSAGGPVLAGTAREFTMIGVSSAGSASDANTAEVRVASDDTWTEWTQLGFDLDEAASDGTTEGRAQRQASAPLWVGSATSYEVRFPPGATDVRVHLVVESMRPVERPPVAAAIAAIGGMPAVNSRATWGARPPKIHPALSDFDKGARMVIVHHTASRDNGYSPAEVPQIMRGLQAYDMDVRHYDDLGYNVAVDRFGGIWEGRFGGLDQPVVGAHAKGFNEVSMGIVVLGNYVATAASTATVDSIASLAGWKLTLEGYRPSSSLTLTADNTEGEPSHPFPLTLPRIVGHSDVGQTACPGSILALMPQIRLKADTYFSTAVGTVSAAQSGERRIEISGSVPAAQANAGVRLVVDRQVTTGSSSASLGEADPDAAPFSEQYPASIGPHRVCAFTAEPGLGRLIGCVTVVVSDVGLTAIRPTRVLDSREPPTRMLQPGEVRPVQLAGTQEISEAAIGAVVNLTVTDAVAPGWLAIFPCGGSLPGSTSNVNFATKQIVAGMAFVRLDPTGKVCVSSNVAVHLVIDVTAWASDDSTFVPSAPTRITDTRITRTRLAAATPRAIQVRGFLSLPADAAAVAINVVAVDPARAGWLTLYPCDQSAGGTSTVNFVAGQTTANLAISAVASDGTVCALSSSATDLVLDLSGWFPPGRFHAMAPTRLLDTRLAAKGRLTDDDTIELPIIGRAAIPAEAVAVFVNLTAAGAKGPGYLSAFPCAELWPGTSSLNYASINPVPNLTFTKIGMNGCLRVTTQTETDVVADVVGWIS